MPRDRGSSETAKQRVRAKIALRPLNLDRAADDQSAQVTKEATVTRDCRIVSATLAFALVLRACNVQPLMLCNPFEPNGVEFADVAAFA